MTIDPHPPEFTTILAAPVRASALPTIDRMIGRFLVVLIALIVLGMTCVAALAACRYFAWP